jgi:hypothetical protein
MKNSTLESCVFSHEPRVDLTPFMTPFKENICLLFALSLFLARKNA